MGDNLHPATFRAGGFALAVEVDVEIWCVATVGNNVCWPRRAAAGGAPSRIGVKLFKLCESSHKFAASAGDERARAILLADSAHDRIKEAIDELVAAGYVGHTPKAPKDIKATPLLQ